MPTWAKVLIGILVAGVIVVAAVIAAGVVWVKRNAPDVAKRMEAAQAEGTMVGEKSTGDQCVALALGKLGKQQGIFDQVYLQGFTRSCLEAATSPPALCASAPASTEILKAATWSVEQCEKVGRRGSQPCARIMQTVLEHCTNK